MPVKNWWEEFAAVPETINEVLRAHGVREIGISDITITDKTVNDLVKEEKVLSNAIVDKVWPSLDNKVVYHYTSKDAAESILNTSFFRLYNLSKRFTEGEIVTFCENHGLSGYLKEENGEPYYKTQIMKNMYYSSFTDTALTDEQEAYFWRTFAPFDGVRLKLSIQASNPNFRPIVYENKAGQPIGLLSDLVREIRNKHDREFVLSGISRLCAFYLAKDFDVENEYRILFRNWDDGSVKPKTDRGTSYIEIPLGSMGPTGYKIEVLEVQSNETLSIPSRYQVQPRSA